MHDSCAQSIEPTDRAVTDGKAPLSAWYMLALLTLIGIFMAVDRGVLSLAGETLKREFQLSDGELGALSGLAYAGPYALAILPLGWLIDRVNRRALLSVMVTIWSLLTACSAFATNYWTLVLARMGVGAAEAGALPASLSLIADTFPLQRRTVAISIYEAAFPAGQVIIFVLGGWILMHFGWQAVFLLAGVPGIFLGALLMSTTREPPREAVAASRAGQVQDGKSQVWDAVRQILGAPPLLHSIAGIAIASSAHFSLMVWAVSFLMRIHDLTSYQAALRVGLGLGLVQTLGALLIGPIAERISKGRQARLALVPAVSVVVCCVAGAVMTQAPTLLVASGAMMVVALGAGFFVGPGYALVVGFAVPNLRGTTLAVTRVMSTFVGSASISYLTGVVSDMVGGPSSIKTALLVTSMFHLWAAFHFAMAGWTSRGDRDAGREPAGTLK